MPLNVRRFYSSILLVLVIAAGASAQTQAVNQPSPAPTNATPIKTMTAAEVMRDRISKAKAFIAVRNYNAAIYELEMIRRETSDSSVHAVTNILLMNSYLEQGNYTKAQNFLNEAFKNFKANNANGSMFYSAVAGQVVKGARSKLERYRSLGLTVSDRNLPPEAATDLEKMRETLELVIAQTKEVSVNKTQLTVAMPILDEAIAARGSFGRDDYDAKRWRDEGTDIREEIASSRSIVINATDGAILPNTTPAIQQQTQIVPPPAATTISNPASDTKVSLPQTDPVTDQAASDAKLKEQEDARKAAQMIAERDKDQRNPEIALSRSQGMAVDLKKPSAPVSAPPDSAPAGNPATETKTAETKTDASAAQDPAVPVNVGSLLEYATQKPQPVYPSTARAMRATGTVKVEVVVDEKGDVAEITNAAGHSLLIAAVKDAVKRWKFRPVTRDGQAVRATGFVNFNFTL